MGTIPLYTAPSCDSALGRAGNRAPAKIPADQENAEGI